jgi:hypothetical protein
MQTPTATTGKPQQPIIQIEINRLVSQAEKGELAQRSFFTLIGGSADDYRAIYREIDGIIERHNKKIIETIPGKPA